MGVPDQKRQLAKTSNDLMEDVRELRRLEDEKRHEPISTDRYHELAETVTDKSRAIMTTAVREEDLGNEIPTGDVSIDDVAGRDGS